MIRVPVQYDASDRGVHRTRMRTKIRTRQSAIQTSYVILVSGDQYSFSHTWISVELNSYEAPRCLSRDTSGRLRNPSRLAIPGYSSSRRGAVGSQALIGTCINDVFGWGLERRTPAPATRRTSGQLRNRETGRLCLPRPCVAGTAGTSSKLLVPSLGKMVIFGSMSPTRAE